MIRNYPASSSRTKQQNLLHNIRQFDLETISLIYDGNVVVVTDRATIPAFLDAMSAAANMHYYSIGISLPFYSWNDLPFQYRQSLFSIEENRGKSGVFDSKDHAFPYLISSIQEENRELGLCHPALIILKEYDDEHQTELFATLFKYVSLERNLVKTSEALHIHRNSLVYRINRIKKLVGSDFDDPEERAFLLLSFYLFPAGDHEVLSA